MIKPCGKESWIIKTLALAAIYFTAGRLSLLLAIPPGYATAVWPPAGIALAALLVCGYRVWPGILLGSFLVNIGLSFDGTTAWAMTKSISLAAGIGAGAAVQAFFGAFLVRRFVTQPLELVKEGDILKFLLLGGPVSCMANATLSVTALWGAGIIEGEHYLFSWWTWWVGDTIGVAVIAPFVLVWIAEPREVWRKRRLSVAAPLLAMFSIVVVFFIRASAWENARITYEFQTRARTVFGAVDRKLEESLEILRCVEGLYHTVPEMKRNVFRTFVTPLFSRHPGIQAVSWNRIVSQEERAMVEESLRAEGLPDFRFKELDSFGRLVTAGERPEYVVVQYIEPFQNNALALGFDISSEATRAEALRRATRSGTGASTAPLKLVQDLGEERSVLIYWPIYKEPGGPVPSKRSERPVAFGTGAFRLKDIVGAALGSVDRSGLTIRILDEETHNGKTVLYEDPAESAVRHSRGELRYRESFDVQGRSWSFECRSAPAYLALAGSWRAWTVLAAGLLFAAVLGAFLLSMTGRAVVLERLGTERVSELSKANQALEREVAERRTVEDALVQTESELRQSQKMDAIGKLAGGIAHDFNNLLTPILGYCELVRNKLVPCDPLREDIQQITYSAEQAARLTRQLLVFSRKDVVQPKVLDLNVVLGEMQKMLKRVIREDIQLECVLRAGLWNVEVDPGQIEQLIINLVVNARDAMPQGGKLTIETMNYELTPDLAQKREDLAPGDHVMMAVSDSGTGMAPEVRAHLFEPFFTTKEEGKGTGLGLSTVYGIVKRARGHISVYSELGQGTSFVIYFPRVIGHSETRSAGTTSVQRLNGTENVLIVEDDSVVRRLLGTILRSHGYVVSEASDGGEAFSLMQTNALSVQLIITDIVMPKMGGMELFLLLSASNIHVKFLCMSGYPEGAAIGQGLIREDIPFIHKPFTPTGLLRKVREILDQPTAFGPKHLGSSAPVTDTENKKTPPKRSTG